MLIPAVSCALLAISLSAWAVPPRPARTMMAAPAEVVVERKLILSQEELAARDLACMDQLADVAQALDYLLVRLDETSGEVFRLAGAKLLITTRAHSTWIEAWRTARGLAQPDSSLRRQWEHKLASQTGVKLEKSILDAWMELDERMIAVFRQAERSHDDAILRLVQQAAPQVEGRLAAMQALVGIAPPRQRFITSPAPEPSIEELELPMIAEGPTVIIPSDAPSDSRKKETKGDLPTPATRTGMVSLPLAGAPPTGRTPARVEVSAAWVEEVAPSRFQSEKRGRRGAYRADAPSVQPAMGW